MLSEKIDLTEHRDFGSRTPLIVSADLRDLVVSNDDFMSSDDYEKLVKWESVFGRRRHYTEVMTVFQEDETKWAMDMKTHCQRCGKLLRFPWHNNDLCEECDEVMRTTVDGSKFPWNKTYVGGRFDSRDILRMR